MKTFHFRLIFSLVFLLASVAFASVVLADVVLADVEKEHLKLYASLDDGIVPEIALDGARICESIFQKGAGIESVKIPESDGKFGGALHFSKEREKPGDLAYETGSILAGNEWTIAFWVKLDEAGNAHYGAPGPGRGMFRTNHGWNDGNVYAAFNQWGSFDVCHFDGNQKQSGIRMPSAAFPAGKWMHLAFTYKNGKHAAFINGNEGAYGANRDCATPPPPSKCLRLGSMDYRSGDLLNGSIDELKLFDAALSAEEIQEIMHTTPGKKRELALYLPLDGEISGEGFASFNASNLIFAPGKSEKGVKIVRHTYDRFGSLTFSGVKSSTSSASLIFDFIPDWNGPEDSETHGLFLFQSPEIRYDLTVKNQKITFTVQTGAGSKSVSLDAKAFEKGKNHRVYAGFDWNAGKIYVAVDETIQNEEFSPGETSKENAEVSGTVSLGNAAGTESYSKTQAEGVLDEVLVLNGFYLPDRLEKRQARAIRLNAGSRKAPIDVTPATEREKPLWDLAGAERIRTQSRERVTLNALWRMQLTDAQRPFDPKDWLYIAVPGRFSGQANGGADCEFFMRGKNLEKLAPNAQYAGRSPYDFVNGWFERGFVAEESWKGREIVLQIQELAEAQTGTVYLNGKPLAEIPTGMIFEVPIPTDRLNFGEMNYLTIHTVDSGYMWAWRGIKGDVSLEIRNPIHAEFPFVQTSVREKKLTAEVTLRNNSPEEAEVCAEFEIQGKNAPKPFRTESVRLAPGVARTVQAAIPWENPELWTHETPNLYDCVVRTLASTFRGGGAQATEGSASCGETVDELPPFRFGFREFEIRGRDFYLNGQKIHFRTHDEWANMTCDLEEARRVARSLKKMGFNSVRINFSSANQQVDAIMRVCDEEGLMQFVNAVGVTSREYVLWNDPDVRAAMETRMASLVRRWRNHPSNVIWFLSVNFLGYGIDYHPMNIADGATPDFMAPKYRIANQGVEILRKYDASRPFFFQAGGAFGEIHTSNAYFCWWPQTERNAWPAEWQKIGKKPVHIIETSFPYFRSYYGMDVNHQGPRPLFYYENLARYYGPAIYENPDAEMLRQTAKPFEGKEAVIWHDAPEFQRLKRDLLVETIPFWRGFDLSGICPFAEIIYATERNAPHHTQHNAKSLPNEPGDFRRFGWHPDVKKFAYQSDFAHDRPLPTYFALQKSLATRLVFIDGGEKNPVDQALNYYSNELLEKRVVLINDSLTDAEFTGHWTLGARTSRFSETVKPGETRYVKIRARLPQVTERTELKLSVELDLPAGQTTNGPELYVKDPLTVTVYPQLDVNLAQKPEVAQNPEAAESPKPAQVVTLYDPVGKTLAKLHQLGVPFRELTRKTVQNQQDAAFEDGLLIVGSESLTEEFFEIAREIRLARKIESGKARLLVMAQKPEALERVGMRAKPLYTPKIFDPEGKALGPWRGKSSLPPEKPLPDLNQESVSSPLWHWTNTNIVASYPLLRPTDCAYKAPLTCGMDLMYTPLLEIQAGKGTVTFCQLDVELRTESDPQADALLMEILERKPAERKTLDGTVLNAEQAVERAAEFGLKTEPRTIQSFRVTPDGESYFAGLTARDRFFRTPVEVTTFTGENVKPLTDPPFAVEVQRDGKRFVLLGFPTDVCPPVREQGLKNGPKSSELWSVEILEDRFRFMRNLLGQAFGEETPSIAPRFEGVKKEDDSFPYTERKARYDSETHVRW